MEPIAARVVVVSLRSVDVPVHPDGISPVRCLSCGHSLDIHQPDADLPYRMLATCDACKCWHLVDCDPDVSCALLTMLPGAEFRVRRF